MIHVTSKSDCCGCNACGDVCPKQAITFKNDEEGFWYPEVDKVKCVECHLCEKVCPFLSERTPKKPKVVYAAINPNENERLNSSSGGIYSMLMEKMIKDKGIVYGAAFDKNWMVCHESAETFQDAQKFLGSKYVQSRVIGCYNEIKKNLQDGRRVLFSGTPCQVAALKCFLGKEFDNLITVDIVCHGVPSPGVWSDYLKTIRRPKGADNGKNTVLSSLNEMPEIEGISFRDKLNGWKKFGFVVRYSADQREAEKFGLSSVDAKIEKRESLHENLFMKGFLNNLYLRPSCHKCKLRSGRCSSDITLGDFWGIWDIIPEIDDDKGISLILLNSEKGKKLIEEVKPKLWQVKYEQGLKYNPCLEHSVKEPKWRSIFMRKYKKDKTENAILSVVKQMQPSLIRRLMRNLKYRLQKN